MPKSLQLVAPALLLASIMGYGCSDSSTEPGLDPGPQTVASADLGITKTATDDGSPAVGETVTYTLRISNSGPDAAANVEVRDSLPDGVSFVSASTGGTESGGVVSWTALSSLAAGSEASFTVTATLTAAGAITNTGIVTSATSDPSTSNNRSTAETGAEVAADVSVAVSASHDGSPAITEVLTYTLLVANAGPSPAADLVITDTLPDGVSFQEASGSGAESEGVVTWDTIPNLAAGSDTTLTVTVDITSAGSLTNTGAVTAATPDPSLENNAHSSEVVAAALSIFPNTGPPGTVIRIAGLDLGGVETDDLRVYLDGEEAPVRPDESDYLYTGIPLFLNQAGESSPPADPVDLVVKEQDRVILDQAGAVTVLPLPQAPGEAEAVADELQTISSSLQTIFTSFGLQVGEEERYFIAMFAALDSLLSGSNENSLASVLDQVQGNGSQAEILDGLLRTMTASDHLATFAATLQAIADQAQAVTNQRYRHSPASLQIGRADQVPILGSATPPSPVGFQVSDQLLALKMQFYVVLRDFGEEVIGNTNQQFSESVGTIAGLVGIARGVPQVDIALVLLAYIDFVMNKLIVGILPSTLDAIDLQLQTNEFDTNQRTNATITVSASNTPPGISLQDMIGNILTFLGASGSNEWIADFTDALVRTATFYLTTMRGIIATYAADHPELNMDPDLFSIVPHITWQARATTPAFYDLKTFTPNIVEPLDDELDWKTKNETGLGRIWVMPSSSADARLLPGYMGGAFGIGSVASQTRSVIVGSDLELEVTVPAGMAHGERAELDIRAGYRLEGGDVNWTSGIVIEIDVEKGSVDLAYGTTDENGDFSTDIHSPTNEEVSTFALIIEARGEDDAFAGTTLEIALGRGLPAYYSNGLQVDEGPINHGFSYSCEFNTYQCNLYQGVCTPIADSPVNWARGIGEGGRDHPNWFSVSWSGYVFAPEEGEYRFSGWVDGDVYIEIDGVTIFQEDTPGSTFSKSIYLSGQRWVPIFMFFEPNIGTNHMMLKWVIPGTGASQFVPRKYLSEKGNDDPELAPLGLRPSNVTVIRRY